MFSGGPDLLLVQYHFDGLEHPVLPTSHGNSIKNNRPAYVRTKESTHTRVKALAPEGKPKRVFHQVNKENGGVTSAQSVSDLPRNRAQVSYHRRSAAKEKTNALSLSKTDSLVLLLDECKLQQVNASGEPFIRGISGALH